MKKGFTLLELLIAATISTVILGGIATVFGANIRLVKMALAETELAISGRQLRDRLLFHINAPSSDFQYGGLLGASSVSAMVKNPQQLQCNIPCINNGVVKTYDLKLSMEDFQGFGNTRARVLKNANLDSSSTSENWFAPGGVNLSDSSLLNRFHIVSSSDDGSGLKEDLICVDLKPTAFIAGTPVSLSQRIYIPIFGRVQKWLRKSPEKM